MASNLRNCEIGRQNCKVQAPRSLTAWFCAHDGRPRFGASLFLRLPWDTTEYGEIQIHAVINLVSKNTPREFGDETVNPTCGATS
jgi:hypothetical protein